MLLVHQLHKQVSMAMALTAQQGIGVDIRPTCISRYCIIIASELASVLLIT